MAQDALGRRREALTCDISVVGDVDAVRAYLDLVVELRQLVGRDRGPGYMARSALVNAGFEAALDRHQARLMAGRPPILLSADQYPDLWDVEGLARRIDLVTTTTMTARGARMAIDARAWLERRRKRGNDTRRD